IDVQGIEHDKSCTMPVETGIEIDVGHAQSLLHILGTLRLYQLHFRACAPSGRRVWKRPWPIPGPWQRTPHPPIRYAGAQEPGARPETLSTSQTGSDHVGTARPVGTRSHRVLPDHACLHVHFYRVVVPVSVE